MFNNIAFGSWYSIAQMKQGVSASQTHEAAQKVASDLSEKGIMNEVILRPDSNSNDPVYLVLSDDSKGAHASLFKNIKDEFKQKMEVKKDLMTSKNIPDPADAKGDGMIRRLLGFEKQKRPEPQGFAVIQKVEKRTLKGLIDNIFAFASPKTKKALNGFYSLVGTQYQDTSQ